MLMKPLQTERTTLRHFTTDDVHDLYEILGDDETMQHCEPAYDFQQTQAFLLDFCIRRNSAVAAIERRSGKLIGYILFNEVTKDVYEIGWFFNRQYWRQGYAYEACQALIDYAFHQLNAHKIFAEAVDGVKSVGLMKKLHMSAEGIQRSHVQSCDGHWADLYLYGLLKDDWEKQRVHSH